MDLVQVFQTLASTWIYTVNNTYSRTKVSKSLHGRSMRWVELMFGCIRSTLPQAVTGRYGTLNVKAGSNCTYQVMATAQMSSLVFTASGLGAG